MEHYVYLIKNKINNKKYIGIHSGDKNDLLNTYFGSGKLLEQAYKKYGKNNFEAEILSFHKTRKSALREEKRLVNDSVLQSEEYYNITRGGGCPPSWLGKTHSEESKKKDSISHLGIKNGMYGKIPAVKGRIGPNKRSRKIQQFSLDGVFLKTWDSISIIGSELKISRSHVSKVCRGLLKWYGGYKWKYED